MGRARRAAARAGIDSGRDLRIVVHGELVPGVVSVTVQDWRTLDSGVYYCFVLERSELCSWEEKAFGWVVKERGLGRARGAVTDAQWIRLLRAAGWRPITAADSWALPVYGVPDGLQRRVAPPRVERSDAAVAIHFFVFTHPRPWGLHELRVTIASSGAVTTEKKLVHVWRPQRGP